MTILSAEKAELFNLAVAGEVAKLGGDPILPWPTVIPGQEVRVGQFGVMIVSSPDATISILESTLFAGDLLNTLNFIVNGKMGKKK